MGSKKKTLLPPSQENDAEVPFQWPGPIGSKIHHVYSNGVPNFYGLNWPQKKNMSKQESHFRQKMFRALYRLQVRVKSRHLWSKRYPLVMSKVCYWKWPSRNRWFSHFHSMVMFRYVNVYQRLMPIFISPSKNITATYFANFHHPPLSSHSNHLKITAISILVFLVRNRTWSSHCMLEEVEMHRARSAAFRPSHHEVQAGAQICPGHELRWLVHLVFRRTRQGRNASGPCYMDYIWIILMGYMGLFYNGIWYVGLFMGLLMGLFMGSLYIDDSR